MLKKLLLIIFVICLIWQPLPNNVFAASQTSIFAKVEKNGVFFYNSPINDDAYKLFEIPCTYFVELLGNADDQENLFYSAKYIDVIGYVKKNEISPVQGEPIAPFASNINFRVFAPSGLDLKSTPSSDSPFNRIINVPYLSTDLVFYGTLTGDQMIPEKSCVWYYCKYLSGTSTYYGFLYSDLCDKLVSISPNTETLPYFEGELFLPPENENLGATAPPTISQPLKILLVIIISLPCLFVIYLIFKPTRLVVDNGEKNTKKIKHLKRRDYYELED